MPHLILVTAPTALPITVAIVMATARVEDAAEEDRFERLIGAATELVQDLANFQLLEATYRLERSHWPRGTGLRLPKSNRAVIDTVEYRNAAGTLVEWDAVNYQVISATNGTSELWPVAAGAWPATATGSVDAVQITYTSGLAEVADLPPHAVTAVEQLAVYLYSHPGGGCDLPAGLLTLIRAFRVLDSELDRQMGEESFAR